MHISAIVPTHNRSAPLIDTLNSLCRQSLPVEQYDIVVVDNASSDDTPAVVRAWLQDERTINSGVSVRYIREERLGLHFARHAGVRKAGGEILAFTDDDAVVDEHWLAALLEPYTLAQTGCVGGKILPRWLSEPPTWLLPYAPGNLSLLDLGEETITLNWPGIFGCNFSIRRSVLYEVGGFNPDSFGDVWLGDGETGLLCKVMDAGYEITYTPRAVVWHVIPQQRMTLRYLKLRRANQGACDAYAYYRKYRSRKRHLLRKSVTMLGYALRHKARALGHRSYKDAAYYDHELQASYLASQARYFWRLLWDSRFRCLVFQEDWIHDE
jgi:glycosyltransferase involved in cell wall biosynthesis